MSLGKLVHLGVPRRASPEAPNASPAREVRSPAAPSLAAPSLQAPSLQAPSLAALARDIEALQAVVATWSEREQSAVKALQRAVDALHKEAFARMIRALKASPAAAAALREAAADEVVYAVLRHHDILRPSLQERIEAALASVRPELASHGGDVELNAFEPPDTVSVRLLGTCDGCSAAGLTMKAGVERAIFERCPEIRRVRVVASQSGASGTGATLTSPFSVAEDVGWLHAVPLATVPEDGVLALELAGHALLITRIGGDVRCFENACAHLGMPLDAGELSDGVITCPHHGFRFSLESGECLTVPEVQLLGHRARVAGDQVEVRLS